MTNVVAPTALRPHQEITPDNVRVGMLFRAQQYQYGATIEGDHYSFRWVVVVADVEAAHTTLVWDGIEVAKTGLNWLFENHRRWLQSGLKDVYPFRKQPHIPELTPQVCFQLHALRRRAFEAAEQAERWALGLSPLGLRCQSVSPTQAYHLRVQENAYNKNNQKAMQLRASAHMIEGNMRAWGLK